MLLKNFLGQLIPTGSNSQVLFSFENDYVFIGRFYLLIAIIYYEYFGVGEFMAIFRERINQ
jgi:hypothetical protein